MTSPGSPVGRPRSCDCGGCRKCRHRERARAKWAAQSPEQRRAIVAARDVELARASDRRRAGTPRRLASHRAASARRNEPSKRAARVAVGNAVRDGRLTRLPCAVCGSARSQAHHHRGYEPEHWFDVVWLCSQHHHEAHGRARS